MFIMHSDEMGIDKTSCICEICETKFRNNEKDIWRITIRYQNIILTPVIPKNMKHLAINVTFLTKQLDPVRKSVIKYRYILRSLLRATLGLKPLVDVLICESTKKLIRRKHRTVAHSAKTPSVKSHIWLGMSSVLLARTHMNVKPVGKHFCVNLSWKNTNVKLGRESYKDLPAKLCWC